MYLGWAMKINFSWRIQFGRIVPICSCENVNSNGKSVLLSLLLDDGGLHYSETIFWIDEGIKRINSVLASECSFLDWNRERWGTEFTLHNAQVYSLLDDSYFQNIPTQQLKEALGTWKLFLESTPDLQKNIEIKL